MMVRGTSEHVDPAHGETVPDVDHLVFISASQVLVVTAHSCIIKELINIIHLKEQSNQILDFILGSIKLNQYFL
jgi:hypothetical protein